MQARSFRGAGRRLAIGALLISSLIVGACVGAAPSGPPKTASAGSAVPGVTAPADPSFATAEPTFATNQPTTPADMPSLAPPPTMPADLARKASSVVQGVRLDVELERNPLAAGELSWVKVTVTNEGPGDLTWLHDACAAVAGVGGASAVAWPMGIEHDEQLERFKVYALGGSVVEDPIPFAYATFVPQKLLGRGSYGCADIGIEETLHVGEQRRETRWWTGYDARTGFLPPAGPLAVNVDADLYWRGPRLDNVVADAIRVHISVPAWITARDAVARLSPGQIVDAALADPTFAAFIRTQEIANGRAEVAWYQEDVDAWEIGVLPWYETEPPRLHGVVVDAITGTVLGVLDRPWDKDVDPFP